MSVASKIAERILHDAGDGHWVMRIDGVGLEPVRECTENELVQDAAFVNAFVIVGFCEAPVGKILRVIINLPCCQPGLPTMFLMNSQCKTDHHEQAQLHQTR